MNKAVDAVAGGWQTSGIFSGHGGFPTPGDVLEDSRVRYTFDGFATLLLCAASK